MPALPVIAAVSAVASVAGVGASIVSGNKARADARHTADLQEQAQDVTEAQNAQQAAEQQRQQIRSQRVQQARILQGASDSGADDSSGELGAIGSLATNLSNVQGISLGNQQRAQQISTLGQEAADSSFDARQETSQGQEYAALGSVSQSIFGATVKSPQVAKSINSIFS